MITKELLLAKRAELEKERDALLNNLNAIGGAIQFCDHLIAELQAEEQPKKEEPA
jgi:hypothetical protein